ncbi:hypothetical protein MHK_000590, partial [Candidatus Magnetomorum sp. HK-1]
DAELIANAVGINYDPQKKYTLLIIDQEEANKQNDVISFIPTFENMTSFAHSELSNQFEGFEDLIGATMTPEFSEFYEQVSEISREMEYDLSDKKQFNAFTKELDLSKTQIQLLGIRQTINNKLGANELFLGNGMTMDKNLQTNTTPFGEIDNDINYGPIEIFTYDKKPQTLSQLEKSGILKRISLNT